MTKFFVAAALSLIVMVLPSSATVIFSDSMVDFWPSSSTISTLKSDSDLVVVLFLVMP